MKTSLVLDTCAYTAYVKQRDDVVAALREAETVFVPAIVYGELCYGFAKGSRTAENLVRLRRFMALERVQLVPVDLKIAQQYGQLRLDLERDGSVVAPNDLWVAAAAVYLRVPLLTVDRGFDKIRELDLVLNYDQ